MTQLSVLYGQIVFYKKTDGSTVYMRKDEMGKLDVLDVGTMATDELMAVLTHKRINEPPHSEDLTDEAYLAAFLGTTINLKAKSGDVDGVRISREISPRDLMTFKALIESGKYPLLQKLMIYNNAIFDSGSFIVFVKGQWVFWHDADKLFLDWNWTEDLEIITSTFHDNSPEFESMNNSWVITNSEYKFHKADIESHEPMSLLGGK